MMELTNAEDRTIIATSVLSAVLQNIVIASVDHVDVGGQEDMRDLLVLPARLDWLAILDLLAIPVQRV